MPSFMPYPRDAVDPDADRSAWVRDVTTALLVLAVFFVILRLLARRIIRLRPGADDWVLLAALVSASRMSFSLALSEQTSP